MFVFTISGLRPFFPGTAIAVQAEEFLRVRLQITHLSPTDTSRGLVRVWKTLVTSSPSEPEPPCTAGECEMMQPLWKTVWQLPTD